jgi:hypothetical protein
MRYNVATQSSALAPVQIPASVLSFGFRISDFGLSHPNLIPTSLSPHRFWAEMIQNAPKCAEMNLKKNIFPACQLPTSFGEASV